MSVALGISIAHNGSVALICDGKVKIAIQAERIARKKKKHLFLDREENLMKKCVEYCLNSTGYNYKDIKIYDKVKDDTSSFLVTVIIFLDQSLTNGLWLIINMFGNISEHF